MDSEFPCAACPRPALRIDVVERDYLPGHFLVHQVLDDLILRREVEQTFIALLGSGGLAEADAIARAQDKNGILAYCPTCSKLYCKDHWELVERRDGPFLTVRAARCPERHLKLIDYERRLYD